MDIAERQQILDDLDAAAYQCTGRLTALVDLGIATDPISVSCVAKFRQAVAEFQAVNAVDKASGIEHPTLDEILRKAVAP